MNNERRDIMPASLKAITKAIAETNSIRNTTPVNTKEFKDETQKVISYTSSLSSLTENIKRAKNNFLSILFLALLISCSPTKKAAEGLGDTGTLLDSATSLTNKVLDNEEQKKAKIIDEYLKANPCKCPPVDLRTLCKEYSISGKVNDSTLKEAEGKARQLINNASIEPAIIIQPYEDLRRIKILEDTAAARLTSLKECEANKAGAKEAVKYIIPAVLPKVNKWDKNNWWFLVALAFAGSNILTLLLKLKNPFKK